MGTGDADQLLAASSHTKTKHHQMKQLSKPQNKYSREVLHAEGWQTHGTAHQKASQMLRLMCILGESGQALGKENR